MNMDILELRSKIVKVNKLLVEINEELLKEFQKQQGFDAGNGCTIPPLEVTDRPIVRENPDCCGDSPCKMCGGTGQIGEEQFFQGRSVGWKACPDCCGG